MEINFSPSVGDRLLRYRARIKRLNSVIGVEQEKPQPDRKRLLSLITERDKLMKVLTDFLDI